MFSKVLISDDLGSINKGVVSVLDQLNIKSNKQVQYCDDAYLQIKKGFVDGEPYELLITDLSFKVDYRSQNLSSGDELIDIISKQHPELPIIVYSVEDRLQRVKQVLKTNSVVAYVNKGRKGLKELKIAIEKAHQNKTFISPQIKDTLDANYHLDFTDYDASLLGYLAEGLSQSQISKIFVDKNIKPSGLSSVEKRLNTLKIEFRAKNTVHLIALVKDLGLI